MRIPPPASLVVFLGAVTAMSLGGCVESRTFYFPSREGFDTPRGVEDVSFTTRDGLILHGWFMRATNAAPGETRPAILHVHGNAGNVSGHAEFSRWLTNHGFHVLVFDYRSYGRSELPRRAIVRSDLLEDARGAMDYLARRPDVRADRIGVFGMSLGGVIGLALAADELRVRTVVSAAAFSSWKGVAADHAPGLGWALVPSGLDAVDSVRRLGGRPLLIVHGQRDGIVSPRHADILAEAARTAHLNVEILLIPEAGHNDLLLDDLDSQRIVAGFFRRTLAEARSGE